MEVLKYFRRNMKTYRIISFFSLLLFTTACTTPEQDKIKKTNRELKTKYENTKREYYKTIHKKDSLINLKARLYNIFQDKHNQLNFYSTELDSIKDFQKELQTNKNIFKKKIKEQEEIVNKLKDSLKTL